VTGVGFLSRTSCALLPARLQAGARSCSHIGPPHRLPSPPLLKSPRLKARAFFGGDGSRTRVLIREPGASTGLYDYSSCREPGGESSRYRLRILLNFPVVPQDEQQVSPGRVTNRSRRSERGTAGSVAIGAYAARAKLPLSLAIKVFVDFRCRHTTCNPRLKTVTVETGAPPKMHKLLCA